MPTQMVVIGEVSIQAQPGFGWRLVVSHVHVLLLHRPPQPLDHDVVERRPLAVQADRDAGFRQNARECLARELAALDGPISLYKISALMGNSPEICRKHYAALMPQEMRDEVEF